MAFNHLERELIDLPPMPLAETLSPAKFEEAYATELSLPPTDHPDSPAQRNYRLGCLCAEQGLAEKDADTAHAYFDDADAYLYKALEVSSALGTQVNAAFMQAQLPLLRVRNQAGLTITKDLLWATQYNLTIVNRDLAAKGKEQPDQDIGTGRQPNYVARLACGRAGVVIYSSTPREFYYYNGGRPHPLHSKAHSSYTVVSEEKYPIANRKTKKHSPETLDLALPETILDSLRKVGLGSMAGREALERTVFIETLLTQEVLGERIQQSHLELLDHISEGLLKRLSRRIGKLELAP